MAPKAKGKAKAKAAPKAAAEEEPLAKAVPKAKAKLAPEVPVVRQKLQAVPDRDLVALEFDSLRQQWRLCNRISLEIVFLAKGKDYRLSYREGEAFVVPVNNVKALLFQSTMYTLSQIIFVL